MQQVWRADDASQSMQELWLLQQKRNHSAGLIPAVQRRSGSAGSLFCVIGNFVPITQQRSEKNEQRELEIPGGYFGRNVVIYVRMRTK